METRFYIVQCRVTDADELETVLDEVASVIAYQELPLDMVTETLEDCGLEECFEY